MEFVELVASIINSIYDFIFYFGHQNIFAFILNIKRVSAMKYISRSFKDDLIFIANIYITFSIGHNLVSNYCIEVEN